MPPARSLKKELILACVLLGGGLLLLPIAVYWVGQQVVGEYESPAGYFGLLGHIWGDLLDLDIAAWLLVTSPYLTIQLLRLAVAIKRRRPIVTPVTDLPDFP